MLQVYTILMGVFTREGSTGPLCRCAGSLPTSRLVTWVVLNFPLNTGTKRPTQQESVEKKK